MLPYWVIVELPNLLTKKCRQECEIYNCVKILVFPAISYNITMLSTRHQYIDDGLGTHFLIV